MDTSIIKASEENRARTLEYRNGLTKIDMAFAHASADIITHLDYALANLSAELEVQAQLDALNTQIAHFGETSVKIFTALEKVSDIPMREDWFNLVAFSTGLTPSIKFTDKQRAALQEYKELRDKRDLAEEYVARFRQCKNSHIREATTRASYDGSIINTGWYEMICALMEQKSTSVTTGQIHALLKQRCELSEHALLPTYDIPQALDEFYHNFALKNNSPAAFTDAIRKMEKAMLKSEAFQDYLQ